MTNSNPLLYLKKGFYFPKSNVSINTSYGGNELKILNPETTIGYSDYPERIYVPFNNGGGMTTVLRYLWMEYIRTDGHNAIQIFSDAYYIAAFFSLLVNKYYFETSSMDIYTINSGSLRSGLEFNYPSGYEGIKIYAPNQTDIEIVVSNFDVDNLMKRISNLARDDLGYFQSATYLIREAKKKFFKGENSGALTDAVSSVEALYLRENTTNHHFDARDHRFLIPTSNNAKQFAFEFLFRNAGGTQTLLDSFQPQNIYGIRSGHLHSGQIDFHLTPHPRNDNDAILNIILICQKIIISALHTFGV